MVGKSYINGIVNGGIPAGIAGLVVVPIIWLLFESTIISQQIAAGYAMPSASSVTNLILETAVIAFVTYLILGLIFGVIGVAIQKWRTNA